MTKDGSTIDYKYDDSGIRQSKTVNGVTTNFTTIGGKITSQNDGTDSLYFRYDKDDSLVGVQVNGVEYLYIKNLQGDIISIVDYDGIAVVNYTYDSFGKVVSITGSLADTIGQLNPMRYREYYYDSETGFYYLQSRYYDSEMQRFINADDTSVLQLSKEEAIGTNLFVYCGNNPFNMVDHSGHFGTPIQWAMAIIGAIAGWFFGDYIARKLGYAPNQSFWRATTYWTIRAGVVIGGAVVGWFAGTAISAIAKTFLLANPAVMLRIPGAVLWFLGLGGSKALTPDSVAQLITSAQRVGSALKSDILHRAASFLSQSQLAKGKVFIIKGGDGVKRILLQVAGVLNSKGGIFEYIIDPNGTITHQLFKIGGIINGKPN